MFRATCRIAPFVLILLPLATLANTLAAAPADDLPPLTAILQRLDRVAGLYRDNALRFTCEETIVHRSGSKKQTHRLEYIYVGTEDGDLEDYRVFREQSRKERKKKKKKTPGRSATVPEVDLDSLGLPTHLKRAYSWVFLFQSQRWEYYRYIIDGQERFDGREAVKIRFEPLPPFQQDVNEWFGTAWIDLESYQPIHVEAMLLMEHRKQQRMERLLRSAASSEKPHRSVHVIHEVVTEFGLEKNGMRFPSEVVSRGSRYIVWGRKGRSGLRDQTLYRLSQNYDRYRFFGVRTQAEVNRIVLEDDAP